MKIYKAVVEIKNDGRLNKSVIERWFKEDIGINEKTYRKFGITRKLIKFTEVKK